MPGFGRLADWLQAVSRRFDGMLQPVVGTQLLIVFGAPVSQEDHARRAILSALDLHQQAESDGDMTLGIALHTGWLEVTSDAAHPGAQLALIGETTAVAMALQENADSGMLICSDETAELIRHQVQLSALTPLVIVGHPDPLPIYSVIAHQPHRSRHRPRELKRQSPLLGRGPALLTLRTLFEQTVLGHGQVVGIVGEPGMGKSRLVETFQRWVTSPCPLLCERPMSILQRLHTLPAHH